MKRTCIANYKQDTMYIAQTGTSARYTRIGTINKYIYYTYYRELVDVILYVIVPR